MRYENYKETSIKWIVSIPAHWKTIRGKNLYQKANRPPRDTEEVVTCFRDGQVTLRKNRRTAGFTESLKEIGYQGVRKGDLVIHVMDAFAGSIGVSDSDGKGTPVYSVCTAKVDLNNYYYAYLLREMARTGYIQSLYRGIRERSSDFRFDIFAAQFYPVPPREEQDQIVSYLDWQTSRINKLIHGYQREIKLLEERKLTIINDAVVHGINPQSERAESKASWMGLVPTTWKQMRMKNFFKEINVRSADGKEPHLSMSQKLGLVTDEENIGRPLLSESYAGAKLCEKDDLVLNRLKAHLGVFALAPIQGIVSPDYTVLRLDKKLIIPKYAEYLFKSSDCRKELRIRVRGIVEGFWRLYTEDLGSIPVCLPDIEEQKSILQYIDSKSVALNVAITEITKQIELLKEYRTRLISDVVTGQMDVRGIEIPDYMPEEDVEDIDDIGEEADEEVGADAE